MAEEKIMEPDSSTEPDSSDNKDPEDFKEEVESLRAELKKVINQRDTAKQDKRKLKKDLDQIKSTLDDVPAKDDIETMKSELEKLRDFQAQITQQEEEEKLKNASEWERKQIEFEKEFNKLKQRMESETQTLSEKLTQKEQELQAKDKSIITLREAKLENEITKAAIKGKALNSDQIVRLLKLDFEYDKDLNKFVYFQYNDKGKLVDEKTVDERVAEFLEDEANENLVEASVNTEGTGTKPSETSTPSDSHMKSDKYDPKDPELIKEADMKRLSIEDLIDTKLMRDKKMSLVAEKRV